MTREQPQLRADLVVGRQETREGIHFVVKDAATGRFYRFGEAEYYITRRLAGETPLEGIRKSVEQKFGASLSSETLSHFVENLRRNGMLEQERPVAGEPNGRPRLRGSLLYLRLSAFDPDRLLPRMAGGFKWCFTRSFLVFSCMVLLAAIYTVAASWSEIQQRLHHLYSFDAVLLIALMLYGITVGHEFAHGLTCKHFGGEVHEMGLFLIYFQPAFYCNVSEAWLFPKKYQRLWVTFAGAYFELFVGALATLTWRVVEPGTWISSIALIVMATSAIKTFFNLNPLIKLDGYYLLSDYLEIPNLRSRSFAYLRKTLNRFVTRQAREPEETAGRDRRIYLAYGLFAAAYSYWLLSLVLLSLGGFLTRRF